MSETSVTVPASPLSRRSVRAAFSALARTPESGPISDERIVVSSTDSPVGPLVTAAIDAGVIMLEFGKPSRLPLQAASLRRWFTGPLTMGEHPHLNALHSQLREYFDGLRREFTLPLVLRGTPFQLKVWQALQRIRFGATMSYVEIAREIGSPGASRAVGNANGLNRIAIVIPCHRVVNHNGGLGGYGGGLWRKRKLLELEGHTRE